MKKQIFIFLFFISIGFSGYSQCCSAGNPAGGDAVQGNLLKKQFIFSSFFRHSLSKDYFHLDKKEPFPYIKNSYYNFVNLSVLYGLTDKFSLHAEMGYFPAKTQTSNMSGGEDFVKAVGFGDLLTAIRYSWLNKAASKARLTTGLGIRIPVGNFSEEQNNIMIPVSLQPSSGALKINANIFYSKKIFQNKAAFIAMYTYEWSNKINRGFIEHKYGAFNQLSTGFHFNIIKNISLNSMFKYEYRAADYRENEVKIVSSGSNVLYFNPIVSYKIDNDLTLIAMADLPLYKYVYGYQLTNKYGLQIGLRWLLQ
jgi:hypothetical protein